MSTLNTKFSRSLNYASIFTELTPKNYNESDKKDKDGKESKTDKEDLRGSSSNSQNNSNSTSSSGLNNKTIVNSFTRSLNAHSNKVHSVSWSCTGNTLGSGSIDKTAVISELLPNSTKLIKTATCKGHTSNVDQVVFSPIHPDIFATAAHDKTVKFWDKRVKDCVTEEGDGGAEVRMDEREKSNPPKRSRGEERGEKDRKRDKEETGECLLGLF